jgi:hypothetical protein
MDNEMLVRISKACDEHLSLAETDGLLHELAILRRKDKEVHRMTDVLLDHRSALTTAPVPVP